MRFPEWDGYADAVLRRVRFFPDRQKIREELGGHLEDAFEALTDGGMEEKEAAGRAVLEMGDSERLGRELNAAHNPVARLDMAGLKVAADSAARHLAF